MHIYLFSVLFVAVSARATEAAGVDSSNEQKSGSYHKTFMEGTSYVVQDFIAEGDLEFYGVNAAAKQEDNKVIKNEEDEDAEALGYIYDLFETSKEAQYIENYEDVLFDTLATHDVSSDHRDLMIKIPSVHCNCESVEKFFNIEIKITPSNDARLNRCNTRAQRRLGNQINRMLLDLGVGDAGVGDSVVFLAKVCNTPTATRRLLLDGSEDEIMDVDVVEEEEEEEELDTRDLLRMKSSGFTYIGGGPCRGCPGDNRDHRKLVSFERMLQMSISMECTTSGCKARVFEKVCNENGCSYIESFCQTPYMGNANAVMATCQCEFDFWDFLKSLNEKIKDYMADSVVPRNRNCCGTKPEITVTTKAVSGTEMNYGCQEP